MRTTTRAAIIGLAIVLELGARGQVAAPKTPAAKPVPAPAAASPDADLDAAEARIGRALFLRGFYIADDLAFDAGGRVEGAPKTGEWTLAGIDVQKAERRGPKQILLEGVRVAIRYNPDNHQFERHPQNDYKMRVLVANTGDGRGMEAALDAILAQGMDLGLQRAMPPYWRHYFNPALEWPPDALTAQTIYATNGLPNPAKDVTPPSLARKVDLKMTPLALKDKVRGTLQLRLVIDPEGVPQRIAVVRPLGYGLEERAVDAVSKWRFTPAMRDGKPVAAALLVNLEIDFNAPPR